MAVTAVKKNIAGNGFEVVTFLKKGAESYEQALSQNDSSDADLE